MASKSKSITLGMACFVTNEAPYLREWIEFHRMMGFEKFSIYDNHSRDNPEGVLSPYIKRGMVNLIRWPNRYGITNFHRSQLDAYNHAITCAREGMDWLAIMDADEFLLPGEADTVRQVLPAYEEYGGIAVNWQTFGTSGVWDLGPDELLTEKLIWKRRADHPGNTHVKTLFRPDRVLKMETQHSCRFRDDYYAVNTAGERVDGPFSAPPRGDVLRINHYIFRTERFLKEYKIPMMKKSGRYEKRRSVMEDEISFREEEDRTIHRFLPELKLRCKSFREVGNWKNS